jgi:hypothetical protein
MIQQLQMAPHAYHGYTWKNEEIFYKGHIYLHYQSAFKSQVFYELHASRVAGHSRFHKTYERIKRSFFWE